MIPHLIQTEDGIVTMEGRPVVDAMTGKALRKFLPADEITPEMRDPDYALKQLEKLNNGKYSVTCSKCHHCR